MCRGELTPLRTHSTRRRTGRASATDVARARCGRTGCLTGREAVSCNSPDCKK